MRRVTTCSLAVLALLVALFSGQPTKTAYAADDWGLLSVPKEAACTGVAANVGLTASIGSHSVQFDAGMYRDFGKNLPIILVHGYQGENKGQWGDETSSTSLAHAMNALSGVNVAAEFQYDSGHGLGDANFAAHARELANAVDCMAQISVQNGGRGKVILVGYSEGSAMAHGASALRSTDDDRAIADEIGQAVTIADARVVYPFNNEVSWSGYAAPDFPSSVTVHSIGANIINAVEDTDGSTSHLANTNTDGVVHTDDAVIQWTDTPNGGGKYVTECYRLFKRYNPNAPEGHKYVAQINKYVTVPCAHGALLSYGPVQNDVLAAITAYATSLTTPPRTWTVNDQLTVSLNSNWGEIVSASMDPTIEGYADDLTRTRQFLSIWAFNNGCSSGFQHCVLDNLSSYYVGTAPSVTIGGLTPDYSGSYLENAGNPNNLNYVSLWCFIDRGVCVSYGGATSLANSGPSATLQDVFTTATWSATVPSPEPTETTPSPTGKPSPTPTPTGTPTGPGPAPGPTGTPTGPAAPPTNPTDGPTAAPSQSPTP